MDWMNGVLKNTKKPKKKNPQNKNKTYDNKH